MLVVMGHLHIAYCITGLVMCSNKQPLLIWNHHGNEIWCVYCVRVGVLCLLHVYCVYIVCVYPVCILCVYCVHVCVHAPLFAFPPYPPSPLLPPSPPPPHSPRWACCAMLQQWALAAAPCSVNTLMNHHHAATTCVIAAEGHQ